MSNDKEVTIRKWLERARTMPFDSFFCITVENRDGPPLVTVTVIPDGGFTKEQIDRATTHLQAIADVLRERAENPDASVTR